MALQGQRTSPTKCSERSEVIESPTYRRRVGVGMSELKTVLVERKRKDQKNILGSQGLFGSLIRLLATRELKT